MARHTNKLIRETSPYLLQHAHNPVNWYPWGNEALDLAKKENKPILVSIGYSACHWCHVMEKESFEDEATADLMNRNFVNIKIDREERPDLDHIYMDAVQAISGSGGWPLNVFLTPDGKPFYGGTYFPPRSAYNRPSWTELLTSISQAFNERRNEIDAQAENLTEHIRKSSILPAGEQKTGNLTRESLDEAALNCLRTADKQWGGFGKAPKFPQTFTIQFLLRYHLVTGEHNALDQALLSLDKMIDGGIYDQVGGGFARYSTDSEWLVPHFEKMLYDNALLVSVLSEALQLTRNKRYEEVIGETIQFVQREMLHPNGGFYSALDADSEGEEGKFYVWDYRELYELLNDDADIFCNFFNATPEGNFEKKNILWRNKSIDEFCKENNISAAVLNKVITTGKEKLLKEREKRVRPQLDDKVLLGWNALMNTALSKAFAATSNEDYKSLAISNMEFLLKRFVHETKYSFYHTWKNEEAKHPAFLDDYAYLIQSLMALQEITGNTDYLRKAREIASHVVEHFSDENSRYFYYTGRNQEDILIRKIELFDSAQPSGNSVMAENLYRLGLYFDLPEWRDRSVGNLRELSRVIVQYPTSFGVWAALMLEVVSGTDEIVIAGKQARAVQKELLREYIPHKILMYTEKESNEFPVLAGKVLGEPAWLYLCRNYTCRQPVRSVRELLELQRSK